MLKRAAQIAAGPPTPLPRGGRVSYVQPAGSPFSSLYDQNEEETKVGSESQILSLTGNVLALPFQSQ